MKSIPSLILQPVPPRTLIKDVIYLVDDATNDMTLMSIDETGKTKVYATVDQLYNLSTIISGLNAINISGNNQYKTIYLSIDPDDKVLTQSKTGLKSIIGLSAIAPTTSTYFKSYCLVGVDGQQLGDTVIDIPKDRFIESISYDENTQTLTIVYITASGERESVNISLKGLVDVYCAGSGITKITNSETSAVTFIGVVDSNSEEYLTVGANGFKLSGINTTITNTRIELSAYTEAASANAYNNAIFDAAAYTNVVSSALNTAITNEASTRETADSQLSTSIESVSGTLNTAITNEASARETADSQLSTSIESVSGTLNTAITNEASARETADSQLSTAIESVSGTLNTAITNEASTRETADNIIQNQISSAFGNDIKVIISKDNGITKSQTIIGGATLADTALSTTLATEAAVRTAIDTKAVSLVGKDAIGVSGNLDKTTYLTINSNDKYLTQSVDGLLANIGISSVTGSASGEIAKIYFLTGKDGQKIAGTEIDIPKDRAISGITYDQITKKLTLVVYTATGSTASTVIDLSGLIDVYNAASGIAKVNNNTFIGVVNSNSENNYLTVSQNGFLLSGINNTIDTASANAYNTAITDAKFYTDIVSGNLQNNIDINTNKLVGINDTVTGYINTEIGKINTGITALTGQVQIIENTISGTNGLINQLTTEVQERKNSISSIESSISSILLTETNISAIITNINNNLNNI